MSRSESSPVLPSLVVCVGNYLAARKAYTDLALAARGDTPEELNVWNDALRKCMAAVDEARAQLAVRYAFEAEQDGDKD